jgi:uridine phosphorylase
VRHTDFEEWQVHINCKKGDLAEYLLVPGDPDRTQKIASHWDFCHGVSSHREFRNFTGEYKDVPISALSSGIGPACMAIAVNEAANVGVNTLIRVGSTGAIQKSIELGDLVISSATVRLDCPSNRYVLPEYPATANHEVLLALIEAAETLGITNYHVGVTVTTADFYADQSCPTKASTPQTENLLPSLQRAGVLNFEMETATLHTLASLCGLRAASVCAVFANHCSNRFETGAGEEEAISVANEAVRILHDRDELKRRKKKCWFYSSLFRS